MTGFTPSLASADARRTLSHLITSRFNTHALAGRILHLQRMFSTCTASCLPPFAGHGVHITPEIHYRCEQWLPLAELRSPFYQFYRQALAYSPVLSSTPFAAAASWAGIVSRFPPFLQNFINPADLLEQLLADANLRTKFLFWSFMPERFYGGASDRYPGQAATICEWLRLRKGKGGCIKCLDAACGDGAAAYGLARLLLAEGWHPHRFEIEGWTLDPLEVWAASHGIFPQSPLREATFRAWVAPVFEQAANRSMLFKVADLNNVPQGNVVNRSDRFDLIVCNGLLGGPIIDRLDNIRRIMSYFNGMLAPGGMLMVADHFHGGWKKNIPGEFFGDVLEAHGLSLVDTAEGVAALKSD